MTQAYPLQWPAGWPRTDASRRARARFGTKRRDSRRWDTYQSVTVADARDRLQIELERLGARNVTLSTNLETRLDGLPRSGQRDPDDPGVAVFFTLDGRTVNLACDKWDRVADNIVAIAKHIEALRGQDRWGVGTTAQAFRGYEALPAPGQTAPLRWRDVLEVGPDVTLEAAYKAYRSKLKTAHPDTGGSTEAFHAVQQAWDQAQKEIGA